MRKYYAPNKANSTSDPEMALTKFDIQRLLNGHKEPISVGFGSVDLFNNPLLNKPKEKLTAQQIIERAARHRPKYYRPEQLKQAEKQSKFSQYSSILFKPVEPATSKSIHREKKVTFTKGHSSGRRPKNPKSSTFLTEDGFEGYYRPFRPEPTIVKIVEQNKGQEKADRLKKSNLVSKFHVVSKNRAFSQQPPDQSEDSVDSSENY